MSEAGQVMQVLSVIFYQGQAFLRFLQYGIADLVKQFFIDGISHDRGKQAVSADIGRRIFPGEQHPQDLRLVRRESEG